MQVIYTGEETPEEVTSSIFLAGPTPRDSITPSWRIPDAIEILERTGYDGVVYVPEFRDRDRVVSDDEYVAQVDWEDDKLNMSDCIVFYVDRNLDTMPAFTTNHEHGEWFQSGKVIFGAPNHAPKNRYLQLKGKRFGVPQAETLEETLRLAVAMVGKGTLRTSGERYVPLQIWNTPTFQSWYADLKAAGNRLDWARVEWTWRFPPDYNFVFYWILQVDVFLPKENRSKWNEVVIARPDVSTIVLYRHRNMITLAKVAIVREFRSPVSNTDGYVWESAGGSSFKTDDPLLRAVEEVHEETGLVVSRDQIRQHEARQLAATMSAHKAHLFSVALTEEQLSWLENQKGRVFGVEEDTERTYVDVVSVHELMKNPFMDWSMVGMILRVLTEV